MRQLSINNRLIADSEVAVRSAKKPVTSDRECRLCGITQGPDRFSPGSWQCRTCLNRKNNERYHSRYAKSDAFKEKRSAHCREYYSRTKEQHKLRRKETYFELRTKVLEAYGAFCKCCGEQRREFLAIDHINNDGADHRRALRTTSLTRWLVRNNFPAGFQTLCHNCNMAKAIYGACPHSIEHKCVS